MNEQIEKWSHKPSHVKLENLNKSYRHLWLTFYRNASICANNLKLLETSFRNSKFSNFSKQLWIFVESKNPNLAKPQVRIVEAFGQSVFSTSVSKKKQKLEILNMRECMKSDLKKTSTKSFNHYLSIFNHFFRREQILWWKINPQKMHIWKGAFSIRPYTEVLPLPRISRRCGWNPVVFLLRKCFHENGMIEPNVYIDHIHIVYCMYKQISVYINIFISFYINLKILQ